LSREARRFFALLSFLAFLVPPFPLLAGFYVAGVWFGRRSPVVFGRFARWLYFFCTPHYRLSNELGEQLPFSSPQAVAVLPFSFFLVGPFFGVFVGVFSPTPFLCSILTCSSLLVFFLVSTPGFFFLFSSTSRALSGALHHPHRLMGAFFFSSPPSLFLAFSFLCPPPSNRE